MFDAKNAERGVRLRYRPAPSAQETLGCTFYRPARAKEPAAIVLFDGEDEPRLAYCSRLEPCTD